MGNTGIECSILKQAKNRSIDWDDIEWAVSKFRPELEFLTENLNTDILETNPIEGLFQAYLNSISLVKGFNSETGHTCPVNVTSLKPKTAYSILPDGQIFECNLYNHKGFYLAWGMKNLIPELQNWLLFGERDLYYDVLEKYRFVEFVTDGKNTFDVIHGESNNISNIQKDILLILFTMNGAADKYFNNVEV